MTVRLGDGLRDGPCLRRTVTSHGHDVIDRERGRRSRRSRVTRATARACDPAPRDQTPTLAQVSKTERALTSSETGDALDDLFDDDAFDTAFDEAIEEADRELEIDDHVDGRRHGDVDDADDEDRSATRT